MEFMQDPKDSDLSEVHAIEQENEVELWSIKNFKDSISVKHFFKIFFLNETIVGFIVARLIQHECEILNIGVTKSVRKKQVASKLMDALIGECHNKNIKHIFLEVRTSNIPAISLYKKFYFNEIGVRPNYYLTKKGHEDAIIMGRDLP
ncbi:MAG: ribosomal-protein-alanine N-acetyltransferase [Betaproteobacteria bacterium]|jgi:ribosomal-protein-alanine N-acetyltransferase|nr:ribosomal-protein-alanine N-acetyltransferase [Betaproteobacteria bacterium]